LSLNSGKRTVVFLSMHQKSLLEYQRRIIDWLMPDVRVVIGSSFHLSNVEIVSPEYIIPNYYTNHHSDFLTYAYNSLATNLPRSKKIWLSRSRLSYSDGRVVGERVVECFLAKHGWEILHPQNLNFFDLLVAIKHAKHIAGFQGSAFHNLIFVSGSTPTITIFSFERNPNYETISKTNLHSYYLKDIQASSILGYRSRKTYLLSNLTMNFPDGLSLRFSYRGFKFLPFKRICFNLSLIFSSLRRTLL